MNRTMMLGAIAGTAITLSAPLHAQQRDPAQMLARADTNGDGRITREEFTASKARLFERLDRNGDGILNSSDSGRGGMLRRRSGDRMRQLIDAIDKDGDGRVERNEFVHGRAAMFDMADSDRNGVIDRAELAEFRRLAEERRHQR